MTPLWMEYVILSFAVLLLPGFAVPFAKLVRTITRAQSDLLPQLGFSEGAVRAEYRPMVRVVG